MKLPIQSLPVSRSSNFTYLAYKTNSSSGVVANAARGVNCYSDVCNDLNLIGYSIDRNDCCGNGGFYYQTRNDNGLSVGECVMCPRSPARSAAPSPARSAAPSPALPALPSLPPSPLSI
ncbi:hypothetical protein [Moorena sp. SIO3H5]|uniref:hypothetical protein n=1 Tax=Moorena sp. SIO3H5 TaxID=2607834 RepID=UPI0013BCF363|nr:hypothetical protein [Moorena sp. SIO3H5]NEO73040.1 hypothetical protein [Moorena sp. SIO3H5]